MYDEVTLSFFLCSDERASQMPKDMIKSVHLTLNVLKVNLHSTSHQEPHIFKLCDMAGKCFISYKSPHGTQYHKKEEIGNSLQLTVKYMKRIVDNSLNLNEIYISQPCFPLNEISINHLENLNNLRIEECSLSENDIFSSGFMKFEQVYKMTGAVDIKYMKLDFDQVKQLQVSRILFQMPSLSSKDINNFLKSIANGELHDNLKIISVLKNCAYEFDIEEITKDFKSLVIFKESYFYKFITVVPGKNVEIAFIGCLPIVGRIDIELHPKSEFTKEPMKYKKGPLIAEYLNSLE